MAGRARRAAATRSPSTASAISPRDAAHFPRHPLAGIGREAPEFIGLDSVATVRALDAGRRVLKLAGVEPRGFVAPAYAYTPSCASPCARGSAWWAGPWALHSTRAGAHRCMSGPPIALAAAGPLTRLLSPSLLRVAGRIAGQTLRVDVHPLDLASPSHMLALEDVIRRGAVDERALARPTTTSSQRAELIDGHGSGRRPACTHRPGGASGRNGDLRRAATVIFALRCRHP